MWEEIAEATAVTAIGMAGFALLPEPIGFRETCKSSRLEQSSES